MSKLNQILAIEKQSKSTAHERITKVYHDLQKETLLSGISRTYDSLNEDGEKFPPEQTQVQVRVEDCLREVGDALSALFDVTATRDFANCEATADVVVDGTAILSKVPATHLLWIEKQLVDMHTLIKKLPTLPQADTWKFDQNTNCYRTDDVQTAKTKKIPKPFVKYEATKEHPAQVEVVHEDILQGYWTTVKFSGAVPATRAKELRERCEKLMSAVKFARESANETQVTPMKVGEKIFSYLLG
jgi:hypothetical protein